MYNFVSDKGSMKNLPTVYYILIICTHFHVLVCVYILLYNKTFNYCW